LTLRLTAEPGPHAKILLEYQKSDKWILIREVTGWVFGNGENIDVGVMACSPGISSFEVEFWDLIVHDYSELGYERSIRDGTVNPNLHPTIIRGS